VQKNYLKIRSIILNHRWVEIELNLDKAHQHIQNDHDKFIINIGQMIKIPRSISYGHNDNCNMSFHHTIGWTAKA
jgi:hypothetical protein